MEEGEGVAFFTANRVLRLPALVQRPEVRELPGGHENLAIHTGAIGNQPPAAAVGRVRGCRRSDHDGDAVAAAIELDRKSTRLNSSHLVISYAVFCLKKKKTPSPLST